MKKRNFHIFEHDIPEMPYYNKYSGSIHNSEIFNKANNKHSRRTLLFFILTSVTIGFLVECGLTKVYFAISKISVLL